MSAKLLLDHLDRIVHRPGAIESLRPAIVDLALGGELTSEYRQFAHVRPITPAEISSGMANLLVDRPRYKWGPAVEGNRESLDQTPDGWTSASLGDTGLFVNGVAFKPADWGSHGRPIIRIQNLSGKSNDFNYTNRDIAEDNTVRTGDILVSWSATLDAYVWRGDEGALNQHIFKVISNPAATIPAFHYWLLKREVRQLASSQHAHGLAMLHINRGPFLRHEVLLPPLEEQERIVAAIDELMAVCQQLESALSNSETKQDMLRTASLRNLLDSSDRKGRSRFFIEHSRRMISRPEHVAEIRKVILDLAVRGRLVPQDPTKSAEEDLSWSPATLRSPQLEVELPFEVPRNWTTVPVQALLDPSREISYGVIKLGAEPPSGGVPTLRCSDVKPRGLDLRNVRRVDEVIARQYSRTRLAGGEVVINVRGTLGGVALIPHELSGYNVAREVAVVPIHDEIEGHYVVNAMASPYFWDRVQESLRGIAYVGLNLKTLRTLPIPIPPVEEQRRIVDKVDELMAICDELERSLVSEEESRATLLEGLLREALGNHSGMNARQLVNA